MLTLGAGYYLPGRIKDRANAVFDNWPIVGLRKCRAVTVVRFF